MRSVAGSSTPASASESPPRNILDEIWTILHGRKPLPGGERAPEQCQGRAFSWRTSDEASAAAAASSEFTLSAGEASYEAQMNSVDHNFIIANYGASQGFDTDDGSSWYDIHDNFFFLADAWKMDYGGHDSRFTGNVVYHGANDGQNCVNTWPFLAGHGAVWEGNRCILPRSNNLAGSISTCDCPGPAAVVPWNASDLESRPPTECGKYCSAL